MPDLPRGAAWQARCRSPAVQCAPLTLASDVLVRLAWSRRAANFICRCASPRRLPLPLTSFPRLLAHLCLMPLLSALRINSAYNFVVSEYGKTPLDQSSRSLAKVYNRMAADSAPSCCRSLAARLAYKNVEWLWSTGIIGLFFVVPAFHFGPLGDACVTSFYPLVFPPLSVVALGLALGGVSALLLLCFAVMGVAACGLIHGNHKANVVWGGMAFSSALLLFPATLTMCLIVLQGPGGLLSVPLKLFFAVDAGRFLVATALPTLTIDSGQASSKSHGQQQAQSFDLQVGAGGA